MDRNKRWKEVSALFLIFIGVFGVADDSHDIKQTFNEMQKRMLSAVEMIR